MGEPRTIDVGLTGPAPTETTALPQGVTFDLEAVYVEIDTSGAAGPVTCELVIAEQSGDVIATKRQSATIPNGGTGTATWALRLADDGGSGGLPPGTLFQDVVSDTVTLPPNMGGPATLVPWTVVVAQGVWDYTVVTNPLMTKTGLLVITLQVEAHSATPMAPGETLFSQLLMPGPVGVFPGDFNLIQTTEATAALPAPNQQECAAASVLAGERAVLALDNNGAAPVDVTYIIRSDLLAA